MDKVTIYKNKPEAFKCQLTVDGASSDDVSVRMVLEFADNKNLLFYGKMGDNGNCIINIPKLKEIESQSGRLVVEAIADSTHFQLYEAKVELKNSVDIKMVAKAKTVNEEVQAPESPIKFKLEKIETPYPAVQLHQQAPTPKPIPRRVPVAPPLAPQPVMQPVQPLVEFELPKVVEEPIIQEEILPPKEDDFFTSSLQQALEDAGCATPYDL